MKEILAKAISTYGKDSKENMAIEEMSELTKEICKHKRGEDNRLALAEEVADVRIMLEQLIMMYDIGHLVDVMVERKVKRLEERIEYHVNNESIY